MSDTEQEWQVSRRPQSMMAQAFSSELDSLFNMDSEVDHLCQTVDQKKYMVMMQSRELEALQARIREAEERLRAQQAATEHRKDSKRDYRTSDSSVSSTSEAMSNGPPRNAHGDDKARKKFHFHGMHA